MRAGELRERVTIQTKGTPTRGAAGGEVITWATLATVDAAVEPISGREYVALRAAQSDVTIRFRIRHRSDVGSSMRIVWQGRNYQIIEPPIDVGAEGRELQLLCRGDDDV